MAIFPSVKNPLTTLRKFRDELTKRTNITNFTRDSKVRALSDVFVDEQLAHREETVNAFYSNQMAHARGDQLDAIGTSKGVPRREATFASASRVESNVAFFVETGTFGSINGGADIIIPSGTTVFSDPLSNELGSVIEYETVGVHVLLSIDSIAFISVKAKHSGTSSNVGQHVLRSHSFTQYIDAASGSLLVMNFYPILNAREKESDDLYRFRLSQHYNRIMSINATRTKLESIEVPGVVDARIEAGHFGIGTAGVIVLGSEFQSNSNLVSGVQSRLDSIKGPGMNFYAIPATEVQVDLTLEVSSSTSLSLADQSRMRAEINRACLGYFRTVSLGGVVSLEQLGRAINTNTNRLVSIGQIGGKNLFKKAFIRRGYASATATDEREKLINTTFVLEPTEFVGLGVLEVLFV